MLEQRSAECDSLNYGYTLRRAIRAIKAWKGVITSKADALQIPHIGEHISSEIQAFLDENPPFPDGVPPPVLAANATLASAQDAPSASASRGRAHARGRGRGVRQARSAYNPDDPANAVPVSVFMYPDPSNHIPSATAITDVHHIASASTSARGRARGRGSSRGRARWRRRQVGSGYNPDDPANAVPVSAFMHSDPSNHIPSARAHAQGRARGVAHGGVALHMPDVNAVDGGGGMHSVASQQVAALPPGGETGVGGAAEQKRAKSPRARPRRGYIPTYRSGPYALIIALFHSYQAGVPQMRKDDLSLAAQAYADKPVFQRGNGDPNTWYSGWSSMNQTLVPKGLVRRKGNPIHFSLTAEGLHLAERLIEINANAINQTVDSYDGGVPAAESGTANLPVRGLSRGERLVSGAVGGKPDTSGGNEVKEHKSQLQLDHEMAMRLQGAIVGEEEREMRAQLDFEESRGAEDVVMNVSHQSQAAPHARQLANVQPPFDAVRGRAPPASASGMALERKYQGGQEFGGVNNADEDQVPSSSQRVSSRPSPSNRQPLAKRSRYTSQAKRMSRVIQRLEKDGHDRNDCYRMAHVLFLERKISTSEDSLYENMAKAFWEQHTAQQTKQERRKPLALLSESYSPSDTAAINEGSGGAHAGPSSLSLRNSPGEGRIASGSATRPTRAIGSVSDESRNGGTTLEPRSGVATDIGANSGRNEGVVMQKTSDVICISSDEDGDHPGGIEKDHSESGLRDYSAEHGQLPLETVHQETPDIAASMMQVELLQVPCNTVNNSASGMRSNQEVPWQGNPPVQPLMDLPPRTNDTGVSHVVSDYKVVLILDTMERLRNIAGQVESIREILLEQDIACESRTLPCGDALFIARSSSGVEFLLDYLIERKTVDDLIASLKDGRMQRQSYLMRQSDLKRKLFVMEGCLSHVWDQSKHLRMRKKIAELSVCGGFYVKHTKDLMDTIWFYTSLYNRLQNEVKTKCATDFFGSRPLFASWMERMGTLKKSLSLDQLFMLQMCQIQGISLKKAKLLKRQGYKTPWSLYLAYNQTEGESEKETMVAKGDFGIGSGASQSVYRLFNFLTYDRGAQERQ